MQLTSATRKLITAINAIKNPIISCHWQTHDALHIPR